MFLRKPAVPTGVDRREGTWTPCLRQPWLTSRTRLTRIGTRVAAPLSFLLTGLHSGEPPDSTAATLSRRGRFEAPSSI